jgi:hypothetical protein
MFDFVVRYLGFLKGVPLLPNLFEAFLILWSFIFHRGILDCMDSISSEVLTWADTSQCLHKYGGMQFNSRGKEIGHIHGNGILDVRFSTKIKEQLLAEGKIKDHHVFTKSGWVSFYVSRKEDETYAIQLLRLSYLKINKLPVE